MKNDPKRSRFVILHHEVGTKLARTDNSHYDWMFDVGGTLRTWATDPLFVWDQPSDVACDRLSDHRLAYLDFEGEMDAGRGRVTPVLAGTFRLLDDRVDRFVAELFWNDGAIAREATVTCYRSLPGARLGLEESLWRLFFSPGR